MKLDKSLLSLITQYIIVSLILTIVFAESDGNPSRAVLYLVVSVCFIAIFLLSRNRYLKQQQQILDEHGAVAVKSGKDSSFLRRLYFAVVSKGEKFAYVNATKIAVNTPGLARFLCGEGVPNHKIECISNWVDTDFVKPLSKEDNAFRRAHKLEGKFVVLYSGNIARTKGVRIIVRSALQMQGNPDIRFVIVGEAGQLEELDELRIELGVTNLTLLPFVPKSEFPEMLAAADVSLIMQKRNVVGFNMPSKTQKIMASGRPIVASVPAAGAAAEAVMQSGGGIVAEPENPTALTNAIQSLYDDPGQRELMGRKGRQFALDHYTLDQAVNAYESLLMSALEPLSAFNRPPKPVSLLSKDISALSKDSRAKIKEDAAN